MPVREELDLRNYQRLCWLYIISQSRSFRRLKRYMIKHNLVNGSRRYIKADKLQNDFARMRRAVERSIGVHPAIDFSRGESIGDLNNLYLGIVSNHGLYLPVLTRYTDTEEEQ